MTSAQLPLRLYLARHGATEWSLSGRSAGRTDLPLSAPGEEAAREDPDEMEPYERLLGDAMKGDATLFTREDSVEAEWRVVEPILGDVTPIHLYEQGTWGPPEAERIIPGDWHKPQQSLQVGSS